MDFQGVCLRLVLSPLWLRRGPPSLWSHFGSQLHWLHLSSPAHCLNLSPVAPPLSPEPSVLPSLICSSVCLSLHRHQFRLNHSSPRFCQPGLHHSSSLPRLALGLPPGLPAGDSALAHPIIFSALAPPSSGRSCSVCPAFCKQLDPALLILAATMCEFLLGHYTT